MPYFTIGINPDDPNCSRVNNILMNYRRYQKVLEDTRLVDSLNAGERDKLQDFVKNHSIIVPVRVRGRQTSLKIRTCIAALHVFITGGEDVRDPKQYVLDSIHRISQKWYGEDGKGLGGFVMDTMVRECFDSEEKGHFDYLVSFLNEKCASIGNKVHNGFSEVDGSAIGDEEI